MDLWWAADPGTFPKCARNTDSGVRSSSVGTCGAGWQFLYTHWSWYLVPLATLPCIDFVNISIRVLCRLRHVSPILVVRAHVIQTLSTERWKSVLSSNTTIQDYIIICDTYTVSSVHATAYWVRSVFLQPGHSLINQIIIHDWYLIAKVRIDWVHTHRLSFVAYSYQFFKCQRKLNSTTSNWSLSNWIYKWNFNPWETCSHLKVGKYAISHVWLPNKPWLSISP